jgi:hypothetical protein
VTNANCTIQAGTSLASCTLTGYDNSMQLSIVTGSGSTPTGPLVEITFSSPRPHPSYPVLQVLGALGITMFASTPTGTTFYISNSGGMTSSTTYTMNISAP